MTPPRHTAFALRLQRTLDGAGFVSGRRRTGALAEHHGVTRETARKWLVGLALPELERLIEIATEHSVSFEWLATGRSVQPEGRLVVRDTAPVYDDPEITRLLGIVRALTRKRRRALIELLEAS